MPEELNNLFKIVCLSFVIYILTGALVGGIVIHTFFLPECKSIKQEVTNVTTSTTQ